PPHTFAWPHSTTFAPRHSRDPQLPHPPRVKPHDPPGTALPRDRASRSASSPLSSEAARAKSSASRRESTDPALQTAHPSAAPSVRLPAPAPRRPADAALRSTATDTVQPHRPVARPYAAS